jgi:nucleotide-binding universal stress UspA family protein
MNKKILVPLDGSTFSEAVLPEVQSLARAEKAEVVILRVPLVPAKEFFGRNKALGSHVRHAILQESEKYVKVEVQKLNLKGTLTDGMVQEGPVVKTILETADKIHADRIAMATHGRTGIQRWLDGSVAEDVVHQTHIPVILIHPN